MNNTIKNFLLFAVPIFTLVVFISYSEYDLHIDRENDLLLKIDSLESVNASILLYQEILLDSINKKITIRDTIVKKIQSIDVITINKYKDLPLNAVAKAIDAQFLKSPYYVVDKFLTQVISHNNFDAFIVDNNIGLDYIRLGNKVDLYNSELMLSTEIIDSFKVSTNQYKQIVGNLTLINADLEFLNNRYRNQKHLYKSAFYGSAVTGGLLLSDVRKEYSLGAGAVVFGGYFIYPHVMNVVKRIGRIFH